MPEIPASVRAFGSYLSKTYSTVMNRFRALTDEELYFREDATYWGLTQAGQEHGIETFSESLELQHLDLPGPLFQEYRDARPTVEALSAGGPDLPAELTGRLEAILTPSDQLQALQAEFEALDEDVLEGKHPSAIHDYLNDLKDRACRIIREQHQAEIDQIEALFEAAEAPTPDGDILRQQITGQADGEAALEALPAAKDRMLNTLRTAHQRSFDGTPPPAEGEEEPADRVIGFEEKMRNQVNAAATAANAKVAFIKFMQVLLQDAKNRKNIEDLAAAKRGPGEIEILAGPEGERQLLKDLDIEDIGDIAKGVNTPGGAKVLYNKDAHTYQLQLPWRTDSYFHDPHNNLLQDLTLMAIGIKAGGHESVTMSINHTKPEVANAAAEKAYEACLRAGFPADKITIKVNGEELEASKIFKASSKKAARETAANEFVTQNRGKTAQMRRDRAAIEEAVGTARPEPPEAGGPPGPPAH